MTGPMRESGFAGGHTFLEGFVDSIAEQHLPDEADELSITERERRYGLALGEQRVSSSHLWIWVVVLILPLLGMISYTAGFAVLVVAGAVAAALGFAAVVVYVILPTLLASRASRASRAGLAQVVARERALGERYGFPIVGWRAGSCATSRSPQSNLRPRSTSR